MGALCMVADSLAMSSASQVAYSEGGPALQDALNQEINHEQEATKGKKGTKRPLKPLSKRKVDSYNEGVKRRGVVYLSRVPPFMKPAKIKQLMEQHGVVTRVYLVEEDQSNRRARMKAGGNSSKRYTEGWVEFEDKKVARAAAESLNNTIIGGKKRNYYHDDIWNLKYLRKFKWDHLTEKVAYERRVRAQKLRLETMQAKRENARYVELVESGKSFAKMEERKRKRREGEAKEDAARDMAVEAPSVKNDRLDPPAPGVGDAHKRIRRRFKQSKPIADVAGGGNEESSMDPSVLKSVFGSGRDRKYTKG